MEEKMIAHRVLIHEEAIQDRVKDYMNEFIHLGG
jgi:hypothetical protein